MTKNNQYNSRHILGYDSFKDLGTTLLILSQSNIVFSVLTALSTFIVGYVYSSAEAVFFLVFLLGLDFLTGCWSALKNNEFKSSKFQRILAPLAIYPLILSICFNMAKYAEIYGFLGSIVYALMIGTVAVSVFENLIKLKLISGDILIIIKEKIMEKIK